MTTILHLKSGISYIGDNTLVVMEEMAANPRNSSTRFNLIRVAPRELRRQLRPRQSTACWWPMAFRGSTTN